MPVGGPSRACVGVEPQRGARVIVERARRDDLRLDVPNAPPGEHRLVDLAAQSPRTGKSHDPTPVSLSSHSPRLGATCARSAGRNCGFFEPKRSQVPRFATGTASGAPGAATVAGYWAGDVAGERGGGAGARRREPARRL